MDLPLTVKRSRTILLCDARHEILIDKDGKSNSYHYGSRLYKMPELKMLVDVVLSARFISAEKSEVLIRKISSLASRYEENDLTARIFAVKCIKGDNGTIFLISDAANHAINRGKKISFQYYDYLPIKEKVLRYDGEVYILSPYAMIWSGDRYYLVGYSDKREDLAAFRIDRMTIPKVLDKIPALAQWIILIRQFICIPAWNSWLPCAVKKNRCEV